MSAPTEQKTLPEDAKLAMLLLRRKVITDGQLKAALDYQRSLGGKIIDILIKLDLVRAAQLEEVLKREESGEEQAAGDPSELFLDPAAVTISKLKVHRRLLDKVPGDLVDKYLLLLFFPLPSGNSRRIILGHGRDCPAEVMKQVRAVIGVDLCALKLEDDVAQGLLAQRNGARKKRGVEARVPEKDVPQAENEVPRVDKVTALTNLLVSKGVISREELEAELNRE
jgi:hypothetical protein